MLKPTYSKQFDRDVKKAIKRGKDIDKLKHIIGLFVREEKLEERYKNHHLKVKAITKIVMIVISSLAGC